MTEQDALTLDDVRQRFLDAQTRLTDASGAIEAIRQSASQLGAARDGLADAGTQVAGLAAQFAAVADAMHENAKELTAGVEAIRLGDPAAIRQEIHEVDAAFTAFQSVIVERLSALGAQLDAEHAAANSQHRQQLMVSAAVLLALIVVGVLVLLR